MTVEYNGTKYTRFFKILLEYPDGTKETTTHTNPHYQHIPKGAKQTCIGFFDREQENN